MKKRKTVLLAWIAVIAVFAFAGCTASPSDQSNHTPPSAEQPSEPSGETPQEEFMIALAVNGKEISVEWEENASVAALEKLLSDGPLVIQTARYGGFEQVGSLPQSLPAEDTRIQTAAGDIMLYASRSIVLFYGSNTWSYTKRGRISGLTENEIIDLLNVPNAEIVLSQA